jgi:hypothetical protein
MAEKPFTPARAQISCQKRGKRAADYLLAIRKSCAEQDW